MKNRYGITPWGSWFVEVLDSYKMGTRLDRGRTYANTGKVLSLKFNKNSVTARVKGSYRPSYRVEIIFPQLKDPEQIYKIIEDDPPLMARIATGELPENFLIKLKNMGINLIPRNWSLMKRSCTCPDHGDPCKHMAALYYIIAKEADSDPHLLFKLRGMDLKKRFGEKAVHSILPPFEITWKESNAETLQGESFSEDNFSEEKLSYENLSNCTGLISSLLPSLPPFSKRDFAVTMAEFYHVLARYKSWESFDTEKYSEMEHNFSRSIWSIECQNPVPGAKLFLDAKDIKGNIRRFTPHDAFEYFISFSSDNGTSSYYFLFYLFKFLNLVCSKGAYIPHVTGNSKNNLKIIWLPFDALPEIKSIIEKLSALECGLLRKDSTHTAEGRTVVNLLSSAFLNEWINRRSLSLGRKYTGNTGGKEYQDLLNVFFHGRELDVSPPALRSLPQSIDRWLAVLHTNFTAYKYNITLRESKPHKSNAQTYTLTMHIVTEHNKDGIIHEQKTPLHKCRDFEALKAPAALSNYLSEIRSLSARSSVRLSQARLLSFLDSAAPLLTRLGMTINLPKSMHRELKPRLLVKAEGRKSLKSYFNLNSLKDFEWQIAIGDETVSFSEFEKLVKEKRTMVYFKDGYVKIDPEELSRLLRKAQNTKPGFNDFLKAHFTGDSVLAFDVKEVINNLFTESSISLPISLGAELRPYQERGFNWIYSLLMSGFGCILADDMGLGKTVQSLAVLLRLQADGLLKQGCLLIVPASLINNWEMEIKRFAPALKISRYHGSRRKMERDRDIILTTYQTAIRDLDKLKNETFSMLLADEAHLMKNAETRLAKTVKTLKSKYRLALSGTPVENRLEDLRSLFDFILPGYLGTASVFRDQYRIPIEVMRQKDRAENLKKITSPFLLRRLKTDKNIIKDLPEKIVKNEYAVLEKEQAALYKSIVDITMEKSAKTDSGKRSALILTLLTSLKQICGHPRIYDKVSPASSVLSGKAQLLITLLEEILGGNEKVIIFSQYVDALKCLDTIIKNELGEHTLLYHGSLSQKIRTETINQFQTDKAMRIMLVSLKAGGLGLNLTAASRVIHYDLWYNPAVENQATDRAFRIGQDKRVFVHRFITKNSFEEKVDAMLAGKQELIDMTVSSGESWLAKMSHDELKELFS